MNEMRVRAQRQFPIVLLTLISIIQALALELLWTKVIESDYLWIFDVRVIVAWGMLSVTLMGILQIWVMYSTMVIGFTWRPSLRDSIIPFILGIQQFMLVSLISPNFNVLWLYVLASVFIVGNWVAHITFRRARMDPTNELFFKHRAPATLGDFAWPMVIVVVLVLFGIVSTILGNPSWIALAAIVFANITLAAQIVSSRRLWNSMMESG